MLRPRNLYLIFGSLLILAALFLTDPDGGLSTGMLLLGILVCVLAVAFAHLSRKALLDYPEADMQALFRRASQSPVGAGLALIAVSLLMAALLMLFGSHVHAATLGVPAQDAVDVAIPPQAQIYAPVLRAEQQRFWPDHRAPELLAGLVDQETCRSSQSVHQSAHQSAFCWSPSARLKTAREEGAGLGQITRAFNSDGSMRFDTLSELSRRHPELQGWSWANVYARPDLQLRAVVLLSRDNYQSLRRVVQDPLQALAFADAAYNGGLGGVQADRRACGRKADCNPQQWFGHVEFTCTKSQTALYGRSACEINREHVHNVMRVRSIKYRSIMGVA